MSNIQVASTLEEFYQFLNEKGYMEIVLRGKNKQITKFAKVSIKDLPQSQNRELMEKVVHSLTEITNLNEQSLLQLGRIARLQNIGLLLNGLNLCATCAGFAIMFAKLDKMSSEISAQIHEVQKTIKDSQDIWTDFEFKKVLSDHMDMLDSQKIHRPYSESQMRKLVDKEYNVLMLLINTFQKDVTGDKGALIYTISSLLSMLTASLRIFDETYYFNNHEGLSGKDVWHMAHDRWMSVYDDLSSTWFTEKLQDYATFEIGLSTVAVDIYYLEILQQVSDLKEEIEDNQTLIVAMDDLNLFRQYKELNEKEIADSIRNVFLSAGHGRAKADIMNAYQNAMQAAAMV